MPTEIKKEIQLEIAHVLFTDIVGYSKLLIDEQHALLETLNQIVRSTEQFRNAEAAGKLIKIPTGDGMALVFQDRLEAPVECALEISRALKGHPTLPLRMGVHSGPVSGVIDVNERANVAGAGINMAQRVMDCGDAGHILLSKHVAEDLEQYARWKPLLRDLGECEVKHGVRVYIVNLHTDELGNRELPEKFRQAKSKEQTAPATPASDAKPPGRSRAWIATLIIVAASATAGFYIFSHRSSSKAPPSSTAPALPAILDKSIAVLPFENLSSDKENAYFAEGIQDEILTRLSKIADLKVISRTSTQQYQSKPGNLSEIAKQLGVAHILEGSVQKSGDAVRVNVQLIKAANDSHLWADTFDRKLTDIFSVESEVARAVADQLRAKLTGQEERIIAAKPTDNVEAYDAYLRGLAFSLKTGSSSANSLGAQKYFKEAVRLDPKFALNWALLSIVDARGYLTQTLQPTAALREEARQAAETALALQPNLGEAVLAKGYYHYDCLKDYDSAVRYFEQARQLLPNSSRIPESLALVERRRGQWDRSESYFNEAERLDPRHAALFGQHAQSYIALRRFPEALRKLDQVLDITPDDVDTLMFKAAIAQAEGDLPRASALLAPLHPGADDVPVLEQQVYQAILERRPGQIIPRLEEILANPDPALGYFNGELRFWLGWAQEVAGDLAAAQESWRQARSELEPFLKEQPDNYQLIGDLALTYMGLSDKAAALTLAELAIAALPIEKDAKAGPGPIEILARVAAQVGEPDRTIAALQKLLSIPYESALAANVPLTPALLRLDPMFDPLRNDPRFQKLIEQSPSQNSK
ncbi:MAG TPA: tetratricopeptide repeat protein [Chthoniobacterales bacterium]|nr:tetratricopeptide repeat protein [Chthoniobacterales bacterium]